MYNANKELQIKTTELQECRGEHPRLKTTPKRTTSNS